ncbi:MAG TPA: 50S ribosomal protein L29 [Candidatus Cloacimonas sp.]|jgi:large subunit ribosomal protein L29|nr:large subunit ribosomal protein [Candidatus Cloacimonadota bacterium]HCX72766.1 50S ribosomal protein L29 [Candidatus Cloacimonas sp.]
MKMNELRELTKQELETRLEDLKEELFNLRFQKASNRLENSNQIRIVKKEVARINTLLTEIKMQGDKR